MLGRSVMYKRLHLITKNTLTISWHLFNLLDYFKESILYSLVSLLKITRARGKPEAATDGSGLIEALGGGRDSRLRRRGALGV